MQRQICIEQTVKRLLMLFDVRLPLKFLPFVTGICFEGCKWIPCAGKMKQPMAAEIPSPQKKRFSVAKTSSVAPIQRWMLINLQLEKRGGESFSSLGVRVLKTLPFLKFNMDILYLKMAPWNWRFLLVSPSFFTFHVKLEEWFFGTNTGFSSSLI